MYVQGIVADYNLCTSPINVAFCSEFVKVATKFLRSVDLDLTFHKELTTVWEGA